MPAWAIAAWPSPGRTPPSRTTCPVPRLHRAFVAQPGRRPRGERQGNAAGMVTAWPWHLPLPGERRLAEPPHALRVGGVDRQAGEELRRHASAAAAVVVSAAAACTGRLRFTQFTKQRGFFPHAVKAAVGQHVSSKEAVVDGEWAGVHVPDRIDQAHPPAPPPGVGAPGAPRWPSGERWKNESPVSTRSPRSTSQLYS